MSLQVWLPLNGNLDNLGLDDIIFSQNTVSSYEQGKIGKALQIKNSNIDFTVSSLVDAKIFSVAFWYKAITDQSITTNWNKILRFTTKNADGTAGSDFRFESSYGTASSYSVSVHNNASQSLGSVGHVIVTQKDQWHHICWTHTPEKNLTYLDGTLLITHEGAAGTINGRIIIAGSSPYPNGLMNDLRIYDHCLSPKEVKEIAKGLVAHYPLNDGIGNENLILNSKALTISCFNQANDSRREYVAVDLGQSYMNIPNGTQVTISFDLKMKLNKVTTSPDKFYLLVYNTNNKCPKAFSSLSTTISINSLKINLSGDIGTIYKGRVSTTGFIVDRSSFETVTKTNNFLEFYTDYGSNNFYEITNIKMEEGSIATPWIPNSADALYSELGLNDNIIYDCSGYCHHGVNANATVDGDAPRYSVSMKFDGTNYITLTNSSFPTVLSNDFTLSMWVHSNDDGDRSLWFGNYSISGGGNFFGFEKTTSDKVRFWWNAGNPDKYFNATSVTKSDGWVLLTLVKEGNVAKIYRNGILSESNTNDNYSTVLLPTTASTFRLGADGRTTGSTLYKGSISDVRIYATALSDEDIKELYETSASIDNHGNMWAYEIQEV